MRQNKNLMDINIDALYNILKKNQGDVNDAMGSKKKTVVATSDPLVLIAAKTNVSRNKEKLLFLRILKESANKKQEFVKTDNKKVEKKDDEKNDLDQEINANMVFMAQIEKVLSDSKASSSSTDEKISK
nr:hypothetical protein [Tanacetum cinerariifolium]